MTSADFKLAAELAMHLGPDNGRRLLEMLAANAAIREFDRISAIRYAETLLRQHRGRAEIRDRLMTRYRISPRTAYRYLDVACARYATTPVGDGSEEREYQPLTNKEESTQ